MGINKMTVNGIEVRYRQQNAQDYISLTDIAKQRTEEPRKVIENWMRNYSTLEYIGL
jgi:Holliday junction resolvase-like predicted endonuclease